MTALESLIPYHIFVKIILPQALPQLYTYAVPPELESEIAIGKRAEIQFGKQKIYAALIAEISNQAPTDYVPKPILSILDELPIITPTHLTFWKWMANYYMCTIGEVMQAALPSFFKLSSETTLVKNPIYNEDILTLEDDEYLIASALEHQDELSYQDIALILSKKFFSKTIQQLLNKKVVYLKETLNEKYQPRIESFVRLQAYLEHDEKAMRKVFDEASKHAKQEALLLSYFDLKSKQATIKKSDLLKKANASSASLESLVKKQIFEIIEMPVDRISYEQLNEKSTFTLSEEQARAYEAINLHFKEKPTVLLHGVTSSGKTLVYIELIKAQLEKGKQVLFLLPEIALTAQLIQRLEKTLGRIGVYHSKFNNAERVEIWNKVLHKELQVIIGARSALFLPFAELGLIIIDEEHDPSYKQYDPAPRYQCRDSALVLAQQFDAKVLLGSATPSIESYAMAKAGKFGLVKMMTRYGDVRMPDIQFVSLTEAARKKEITTGITFVLRDAIHDALNKKEQVILFQNRRGYAPYIACKVCNWIPQCKNCDVSLTYHKFTNDLRCHYCGYSQSMIHVCKACGSHDMQQKGIGTERLEDDLKMMFPLAQIGRMDYDTVRTKKGHEKIITAFEEGAFDILVGTQMVTKGLDFERVNLVGVVNADALLAYPDFRALERAYQLLVQVSGRAGRKEKQGKVLIQIGNIHHVIVDYVLHNAYDDFYNFQMLERKQFDYPPYSRLIQITLKHKELKTVVAAANKIAEFLNTRYSGWIVGPNAPIIQKINNLYLRDLYIKIPRNANNLAQIKADIRQAIAALYQYENTKAVRATIDVDCYG